MKLALLPTDWLMWAGVLVVLFWVWRVRRQTLSSQNWQKVFMRPAAMVSGVVLACFVMIALLDSVRWVDADRKGDAALSVLDRALEPLVKARERRYSAPLAYLSFRKESIDRDGQTVRDYPRLKFGGSHLQDPERQWASDITERSAKALAKGLILVFVIGLALSLLLRKSPYPWRWAFACFLPSGLQNSQWPTMYLALIEPVIQYFGSL